MGHTCRGMRQEREGPLTIWMVLAAAYYAHMACISDSGRVQVDCVGGATLYSSPDLQSWSLEGSLATQVGAMLAAAQHKLACLALLDNARHRTCT